MELAEYARVAAVEDDHWWYRSTRRLMQGLLSPWLRSGIVALDVGCGPGGNGAWLTRFGTVVALDVEAEALAFVQSRRSGLEPVQASATDLPFPAASFDVVIAVTVLYHVADDERAVAEAARVLRPGGALFIVEPALEWLFREHDAQGHGRRRYSAGQLAGLFERSGLTIRRATYAKSFLVPPAAALGAAYRMRRTAPAAARSDLTPRRLDRVTDPLFARLAEVEDRRLARRDVPVGTSAIVVAEKPTR